MKQDFGFNQEHSLRHELPHSLELAKELEETEDVEVIREKLGSLLESIAEDTGVEFTSDVNTLYQAMAKEGCLVRVEKLSRVLETVELGSPLDISDEKEAHFANAVIPMPEGIKIALSEGQAPGPVRIMVGFGKTIIGFKTDNISVSEVEFSESDIRDPEERKFLCRHVSGSLQSKDVGYVVIRIPSDLLAEKYLTKEEKKKKMPFVFRGAKLQ